MYIKTSEIDLPLIGGTFSGEEKWSGDTERESPLTFNKRVTSATSSWNEGDALYCDEIGWTNCCGQLIPRLI